MKPSDWHKRFLKQAQWTKDLRGFLLSEIHLDASCRILEVGCGTGAVLSEISNRLSNSIYGVDICNEYLFLASEHVSGVNLTLADAHFLPFEKNTFHLTFCHFLLLWVNNPARVLDEMIRVTVPGGVVAAMAEPDYDARIDFPDQLSVAGKWQSKSLTQQGADPNIGRKLTSLFNKAGMVNVNIGILGGQWDASSMKDSFNSEWEILSFDLDLLPDPPDKTEINRIKELDIAARKAGERVLFVPTFYGWGYVSKE